MITVTTIKRAERLLRGGVNVSQLTLDQDDLCRLGVPDQEHEAILHGDAGQQVEHLLPYVRRMDAQRAEGKARSRRAQLRRQMQDLVRSAKCAPDGVELAPQALACVVSGPDFKVLNLLGPIPVRLPRLLLRRALKSVQGCEVVVVLEGRGLRIRYGTSKGHGQLFLLDQPHARGEPLIADLSTVRPRFTEQDLPRSQDTSGPGSSPRTARSPLVAGILDALLDLLAA